MENQCQHITELQRNELLKLLQNFEDLFDETLGTWARYPVDFELKEYAEPILSRIYTVLKVHEEMFKNRLNI